MPLKSINPASLGAPSGFSHGVVVDSAKLLFVAGQIATDEQQKIVSADFVDQFDRALANLISVVEAAGGSTPHIARLIIYVTDKQEYSRRKREVGERYRARMGKHFPAMSLVQVAALLEPGAKVEIEGLACL